LGKTLNITFGAISKTDLQGMSSPEKPKKSEDFLGIEMICKCKDPEEGT
jgi:hypothetical protein